MLQHAPSDVEICAFLKVLEHSLDELFFEDLSKLKTSIHRLLRTKLSCDMAMKSNGEIEAALSARE